MAQRPVGDFRQTPFAARYSLCRVESGPTSVLPGLRCTYSPDSVLSPAVEGSQPELGGGRLWQSWRLSSNGRSRPLPHGLRPLCTQTPHSCIWFLAPSPYVLSLRTLSPFSIHSSSPDTSACFLQWEAMPWGGFPLGQGPQSLHWEGGREGGRCFLKGWLGDLSAF